MEAKLESEKEVLAQLILPGVKETTEGDEYLAFKYARERGMPYYSYSYREKLIQFEKIKQSGFKGGVEDGEVLQSLNGIALDWLYFRHHW